MIKPVFPLVGITALRRDRFCHRGNDGKMAARPPAGLGTWMQREDRSGSPRQDKRGAANLVPGALPAAAIAVLIAALTGYLGRPGANASRTEGTPDTSRVAEVAPSDLTAALETVSGAAGRMAKDDSCNRRLAWVTLSHAPGQAPGQIRLQSGTYISPSFELSDTPVRVAIPFPNAYPIGHGVISVIGTTTDAIVALAPAWHVTARSGFQTRTVSWKPIVGCQAASN